MDTKAKLDAADTDVLLAAAEEAYERRAGLKAGSRAKSTPAGKATAEAYDLSRGIKTFNDLASKPGGLQGVIESAGRTDYLFRYGVRGFGLIGAAFVAFQVFQLAERALDADSDGEAARILIEGGGSIAGSLILSLAGEVVGGKLGALVGGMGAATAAAETGPGALPAGFTGARVGELAGTLVLGFIGGWYGGVAGEELGSMVADELGLPPIEEPEK